MAILSHLKFPVEIDDFGDKQEYTIVVRRSTAKERNDIMASMRNIDKDDNEGRIKLLLAFFDTIFIRTEDLQDADGRDISGVEFIDDIIKIRIASAIANQTVSIKNLPGTSTSSEPEKKSYESTQTNQ